MNLPIIPRAGLIAAILILFSCNGNLPEPKYVVNLEGLDFQIQVNEEVRKDTPSLAKVQFSAITGSYCQQAKISASSSRAGNKVSFRIHHIDKVKDCPEANSIPSRNLVAGFLENGSYEVSLGIGQSVHYDGTLEVDDAKYLLSFDNAPNIFIEPEVTMRVPDRAVWFRMSHLAQKSSLAAECLSRIENMTLEHNLTDGFYSYFEVEDGNLQLLSKNDYDYLENKEKLVILPDTTDQTLNSLYRIFQEYRELAGHQFYVDLKTWNNEVFKID